MFIFKMKNRRACQSAPTCSHISPREHTLRLTSKTSPEAGTVSYTYNTDGTVATVTDAKSQQKTFTYDSYGRVTKIKAPGQSISYSYGSSYDGTNTLGRVATINYSVGSHTVQEGYNYTQAGDIAAKGVALDGYIPLNEGSLIATYSYDGEGHLTSVAYPVANTTTWGAPAAIYNYGLDSMGRLNTMTDQNNNTLVSGVTYSPANQILSLATSTFTETSTYNANLQLATLVSGSYSYQYNYVANQNNGRVQSIQDNSSGEKVSYLYDSLNRMIQASGLYDPHGSWSQQFTYDGFGNLTQKIGTNAPNNLTINVDPTTNRLTGNGAVYDANGNLTQYTNTLSNITFTYDSLNRLATATGWNGGSGNTANYGYDASNQRVYSNITVGGVTTETFFFYGADGKKLGVWTIPPLSGSFTLVSLNTWFGGRLLKPQDRLNSIGKYFPYGEDRYSPSPANPTNGQEKFATYTRDAETGLDYAYQRYYTAGLGRFMTPDPLAASASVMSPQSQNRYPYANNDPANNADPGGTDAICGANGSWDGEGCSGATGYYAASTATPPDPYAVYASSGMQVAYGCLVNQQDGFLPIALCTGDPNAPIVPPTASAPPDCAQLLKLDISIYLQSYRFKGAASPLVGEANLFVVLGAEDNIDPRLLVGIAQHESNLGLSPVAQRHHNAYGILMAVGPRSNRSYVPRPFDTLSASTVYAFGVAAAHISQGQTSVSTLYSGAPGSYCVDSPQFPCVNAIADITSVMNKIPNGNPQLVRPADPSNLTFPCEY